MAKKRFRDIEIWDKEWYMDLRPRMKCLVDFLFDNCDVSGVWSPNWKLLNLQINDEVKFTIEDIKKLPEEHFEILPNGKIFLPEFIDFQYGKLSEKCAPHISVFKAIENNNLQNRVFNRVSNTLKEKDKEMDKEEEKEMEEEKEIPRAKKTVSKNVSILFKDSEYFDLEILKEKLSLKDSPYNLASATYYYEAMKNWSEQGAKKKVNWLSTCMTWILNDFKDGKLITQNYKIPNGTNGTPKDGSMAAYKAHLEGNLQ